MNDAAQTIRALIVDDDELALAMIESVLEPAGVKTFTMLSPIGATKAISEHDVHIVIVDVNMPSLRGDRIVSLLKGWERTKDLPIVLISGSADTLSQVRSALPGVATLTKDRISSELAPLTKRLTTGRRSYSGDRSPSSGTRSLVEVFQADLRTNLAAVERARSGDPSSAELPRRFDQLVDEASLLGFRRVAECLTRVRAGLRLPLIGPSAVEQRRLLDALAAFAGDPSGNEGLALGAPPTDRAPSSSR